MMKRYFLLLPLMFVLTSCGGAQYEKKYTFIPPKDKDGAQCANQCIIEREKCLQRCMDRGSVVDMANKVISSVTGGSDGGGSANACSNSCIEAHRICHVNCGGQVKEENVCVAYCKNQSKN